jgi:hypothetical protein
MEIALTEAEKGGEDEITDSVIRVNGGDADSWI